MAANLKIGIICDDMLLQQWEYASIEKIKHSGFADIMLVMRNSEDKSGKKLQRSNPGNLMIRFHQKLDALIFNQKNDYSKRKNISRLVENVPVLIFGTSDVGETSTVNDNGLAEITKYDLEIILNFGSGHLKGKILQIPRYGIWSFPFSERNKVLKIRCGYREVVKREPVTVATLIILKEGGGNDLIISSSSESTCSYSINITRNKIYWRSALFVSRLLEGLHKYGDDYFKSLIRKHQTQNYYLSLQDQSPLFFAALGNLLNHFALVFSKVVKKFFYTDAFKWVLYYDVNNLSADDAFRTNFSGFKKLMPPKGKFWGDPFVLAKNGNYYVFVEEFLYRTDKGHLSVLELDPEGRLLKDSTVIERPFHLSYPFIFELDNTYYMIPESSGNRTVDLYRCTQFPDKWEYVMNIMKNIRTVDTTLFFYSNKWWLFTVSEEIKGMETCETELFLYYSDNIFSDEWKSHPLNPVVADSRSARPAGNIFILNGKIYRPSQDCSVRYGNALNLNEIVTLSETGYEERTIYKRKPDWDRKLKGMHTFNSSGGFSIIDAYSYHRRSSF